MLHMQGPIFRGSTHAQRRACIASLLAAVADNERMRVAGRQCWHWRWADAFGAPASGLSCPSSQNLPSTLRLSR